MLINTSNIETFTMHADDGDIGAVKDVLFDDESWTIRYLVIDTQKWLPASRKVVLSPVSIGQPDADKQYLPVNLTCDKIKNSPSLEEHQPVSRRYEAKLFQYYGYAQYWSGPGLWGTYPSPAPLADGDLKLDIDDTDKDASKLRSTDEIIRYQISATDKKIGHVKDFIVNTDTWHIDYLVVNTRDFFPGGKNIVVSTDCIASVSWLLHAVDVNLDSQTIIQGPELDDGSYNSRELDALCCDSVT